MHAVTTMQPACKYSFELQRIQAEDPHVVHAMTLAITVEVFFQLKNRQRNPIAWVICSDSNLHALQVNFGVQQETSEAEHGMYMQ